MADSCLWKLSLQLIFVTLSLSTTVALSFFELAEEDGFGHAYVSYSCDVASPVQLHQTWSRMDSVLGRLACYMSKAVQSLNHRNHYQYQLSLSKADQSELFRSQKPS